jgi:hypothetical protein
VSNTASTPTLYNDGLWRLPDGTVVPDPAAATAPVDPFTAPAPVVPGTLPVTGPVLYSDGLWRMSDGTIVPDPADASAPPDPFLDVSQPAPVVVVAGPAPVPVAPPGTPPPPGAPGPVAVAAPTTAVPVIPGAPVPVAAVAPATFLPPQASPAVLAASTDVPVRPVGTALVPGQLVAFVDDSTYGDPTRAGIVLVAAVDEAGVNTAILGWFDSTSHPIDTARLSVI